jgi:hypothetical protein
MTQVERGQRPLWLGFYVVFIFLVLGWGEDISEQFFKNKKYKLLLFLATNMNMLFSKKTLYGQMSGFRVLDGTTTVMVHINTVLEKIEADPSNLKCVQTVWYYVSGYDDIREGIIWIN